MNRARLVLADPPWEYNDRQLVRKDNPGKKPKFGTGAHRNYKMGTNQIDQICEVGKYLADVTTKDAYLCMWVTGVHLTSFERVMNAWGFVYRTPLFVWVKTTSAQDLIASGPGHYTAQNAEYCMLGRRKNTKCWHTNKGQQVPKQVFMAHQPRDEKRKIVHSQKPANVHEALERWLVPQMGDYSKIELYARRERPGWICLGGDLSNQDITYDLQDLAYEMGTV